MTDRHAAGISRNGLPVDPVKQREWQRRGAVNYAAKRRRNQLQHNQARLTTKIAPASSQPRKRNDWPAAVRRLAVKRSGGVCERCGEEPASELHHRKSRRCRDHRICNALHLCAWCHDWIDDNPKAARLSGWIVPSTLDPAVIAVTVIGRRVILTDTGDYEMAA